MAQKSNLIGLARTALANGGKIFVTPVAESDSGVVSFRVYTSKVSEEGEVSLRDITRTLKNVPGADLKHAGRPRKDETLRAKADGRVKASTVLGRQIATALYGDEGKVTVQAL